MSYEKRKCEEEFGKELEKNTVVVVSLFWLPVGYLLVTCGYLLVTCCLLVVYLLFTCSVTTLFYSSVLFCFSQRLEEGLCVSVLV